VPTTLIRFVVAALWIGQAVLPLRAQSPADQLLPDQTERPCPTGPTACNACSGRAKADTNRVRVLLELGAYYLYQAREMGAGPDSADGTPGWRTRQAAP
jgi:hypothetical protein